MDQGPAPASAGWSLRSRGPAHAVSHRCLELQRAARPHSALSRLLGRDPLHPDAVSWYREALGERRVGRMLMELGPGWRVLHAVPHGVADEIDHLVIGPAGVFTATSTPSSALRDARSASRLLTRATGVSIVVEPLVATVGGAARLVRHLHSLPARLEADLVATIARVAEEWTTWRPFGVDLEAHSDPDAAFDRLRAEVDRARGRRVLWSVAGIVVIALALVALASAVLG